MNLEGANPVFGLNALGGSLAIQLKNGFTYHGGEIDAYGGSFGQIAGAFQYGKQSRQHGGLCCRFRSDRERLARFSVVWS